MEITEKEQGPPVFEDLCHGARRHPHPLPHSARCPYRLTDDGPAVIGSVGMTALLDAVNMAESAHLIPPATCGAESETGQTNVHGT